ncbi:oligosaccharide flippase family protein [uncultured Desulfobacter sp.]|uniref:lipopolysaccharide biosynthesis protein n=1 Tax=uncultured Desulfobacter sp. TaxID=240139 RepID=UPI002AAAEF52|nr:oligosaccharide flippase family protein [uncultured Desulfobacter sp.]
MKKRYFAKLFANCTGLLIGLVTQMLIPRGLGPKIYGDFEFLSNFFSQVVSFLEMGTSVAFYTKLSQRPKEFGLVAFYIRVVGLLAGLVFIFVGCCQISGAYIKLWPDQKLFYVYLAAIWGIFTFFVNVVSKMADAYGMTVSTEIAKIIQQVIGLVIILVLYGTNELNLISFFFYHYFIFLLIGLCFLFIFKKYGFPFFKNWKLSLGQLKGYVKEFYTYSHPLVFYSIAGLLVGIFDRWLLQCFSGSVQQGFFGLSYKIGAICFLFTSAMTPLITREFSIAFQQEAYSEMARLFRRFIPMLYSISSYFACFIALEADKVTVIFGGNEFCQAILPVTIMAFYPIHQTYGQLSGSVFLAAGRTRLYSNIGVFFLVIGIPVTWFLVGPVDKMGLNMGATGLALKMVIIQFLSTNTKLWFNARYLGLRFWLYMAHQGISMLTLLVLAYGAISLVRYGLRVDNSILLSFFLDGVLYSIMVVVALYFQPIIFGLEKNDIRMVYQYLKLSKIK